MLSPLTDTGWNTIRCTAWAITTASASRHTQPPDLGQHAILPFLHAFSSLRPGVKRGRGRATAPRRSPSRYCCFSASSFSRMSMNSAPVMVSFSSR